MKTVTIWLNDDYQAVDQEDATHVEIIQSDDAGTLINRTYGSVGADFKEAARVAAEAIAKDLTEEQLEELLKSP